MPTYFLLHIDYGNQKRCPPPSPKRTWQELVVPDGPSTEGRLMPIGESIFLLFLLMCESCSQLSKDGKAAISFKGAFPKRFAGPVSDPPHARGLLLKNTLRS
jgi:hypothetical protein